jgi:DNA-binding SARP family transcriptional activator
MVPGFDRIAMDRSVIIPAGLPPRLCLRGRPTLILAGESGDSVLILERKTAGLLCYLQFEGGTPRQRLASLLWPEVEERTARNNLAQLLRRLRQRAGDIVVVAGEPLLRLAGDIACDLPSVERGALGASGTELLAGLDYVDCPAFDDWLQTQRERLALEHRAALEALSEEAERAGDLRAALGYAHRLLADDRCCEASHRRLIRLHWLLGDRSRALAAFRRCREILRQELGVEPETETLALERSILKSVPFPVPPDGLHRLPSALLRPPVLVGRAAPLAALATAWEGGLHAFICGPVGIGKTRLMQDFVAAYGRSYLFCGHAGDRSLPLSSLAALLADLRRAFAVVPLPAWAEAQLGGLVTDRFGLGASPAVRAGLAATAAALVDAAANAGLQRLAFDDLHLMDDESLEVLLSVLDGLCTQSVRAVCCLRPGELSRHGQALLEKSVQHGAACLATLDPLDAQAMNALLAGIDPALPPLSGELLEKSRGVPRVALEILHARYAAGLLPANLPGLATGAACSASGRRHVVGLSVLSPHLVER